MKEPSPEIERSAGSRTLHFLDVLFEAKRPFWTPTFFQWSFLFRLVRSFSFTFLGFLCVVLFFLERTSICFEFSLVENNGNRFARKWRRSEEVRKKRKILFRTPTRSSFFILRRKRPCVCVLRYRHIGPYCNGGHLVIFVFFLISRLRSGSAKVNLWTKLWKIGTRLFFLSFSNRP